MTDTLMTGTFEPPALRPDDVLTPDELANHRSLARLIYSHIAETISSHTRCTADCRRRGQCLYVQPDALRLDEAAFVEHNLRQRDMPFCLAVILDDPEYDYLRNVVVAALR